MEEFAELAPLFPEVVLELGQPVGAKRTRTHANACADCGVVNKYQPPSGHLKSGWCPVQQRFSADKSAASSAGNRLRDLRRAVEQGCFDFDDDTIAWLRHLRDGNAAETSRALQKRHELILLTVPGRPYPPLNRPLYTWSVVDEALSRCTPQDDHSSASIQVLCVLLEHCSKLRLDVNSTLPRKSDSWARVAHQAAYRGNKLALSKLLGCGVSMFAETRSGWLPIHNACRRAAPGCHVPGFIEWLLTLMDEEIIRRWPASGRDARTRLREHVLDGFEEAYGCDVVRFRELVSGPDSVTVCTSRSDQSCSS